jgi:hypothetical protein
MTKAERIVIEVAIRALMQGMDRDMVADFLAQALADDAELDASIARHPAGGKR